MLYEHFIEKGESIMKNSWDYKKGDLIKVEKLGWPIEIGVIIRKILGMGWNQRKNSVLFRS